MPEIIQCVGSALISVAWQFLQASQADALKAGGSSRIELPWRGRGVVAREREEAASKGDLGKFLGRLEDELEKGRFFPSEQKRPETVRNLRALFGRATPTDRELRMLHGLVTALTADDV